MTMTKHSCEQQGSIDGAAVAKQEHALKMFRVEQENLRKKEAIRCGADRNGACASSEALEVVHKGLELRT